MRPLQALVDHAESSRRFVMMLVGIFSCLGCALAGLGIYGVMSYAVSERTQEIGVRMALGATPGRVQREIVTRSLWLAIAGIAAGSVASITCARLIESLLFGVSPWDAVTYAGVVCAIVALALVSGYLPARRASRIDPLVALRTL